MKPANTETPPAYDFTKEGMRVWKDGKVETTFPKSYYGNMVHGMIKEMQKDLKGG